MSGFFQTSSSREIVMQHYLFGSSSSLGLLFLIDGKDAPLLDLDALAPHVGEAPLGDAEVVFMRALDPRRVRAAVLYTKVHGEAQPGAVLANPNYLERG